MRALRRSSLLVLVAVAGCSSPPPPPPPPPPPAVVLATDFGLGDDAVGLMRGVIHKRAPRSAILDLTHRVPRFDVQAGAQLVAEAPGVYPAKTVFVVVIDPGVGTKRRAIVAKLANGSLMVAPDNGVLTWAIARHGPAEIRAVTNEALMRRTMSATFHGRDLFAPVGGHLAGGTPFSDVGPVVGDWIRLKALERKKAAGVLSGVVTAIDEPFGNVWTNLPADWLRELPARAGASTIEVKFLVGDSVAAGPFRLPLKSTFGEVPEGKPLAYVNSRGMLSLARNMADFARTHKVQPAMRVEVRLAK